MAQLKSSRQTTFDTKVRKDEGTMLADPTVALGVATKGYVDAAVAVAPPIIDASITYGKLEQHVAGDIIAGDPLVRINTTTSVWQISPAYVMQRSGVVRTSITLAVSGAQTSGLATIYGTVYVNGVAATTQRGISSGGTGFATGTWAEDITVVAGDSVTVGAYVTSTLGHISYIATKQVTLTFKLGNRITL